MLSVFCCTYTIFCQTERKCLAQRLAMIPLVAFFERRKRSPRTGTAAGGGSRPQSQKAKGCPTQIKSRSEHLQAAVAQGAAPLTMNDIVTEYQQLLISEESRSSLDRAL